MSFANAKKIDLLEKDTSKCEAYGCPCRASINLGVAWTCSAHSFAESGSWQEVTQKLRANDWLMHFVDEIRSMNSRHLDWRDFSKQFWSGADDFCIPTDLEPFFSYENRMRDELNFRVGVIKRRPEPRKFLNKGEVK